MYTEDITRDYYVEEYKIRKEDDFWIAHFPNSGMYYATNEIGKDILQYFDVNVQKSLFEYLSELYGELTDKQMKEVEEFINKLKETSILERKETK